MGGLYEMGYYQPSRGGGVSNGGLVMLLSGLPSLGSMAIDFLIVLPFSNPSRSMEEGLGWGQYLANTEIHLNNTKFGHIVS